MITKKMYRYLGRNGVITSAIILENVAPIPMISLKAEQGKVLINGTKKAYEVTVFEDEINDWHEIEDNGQK